MAFQAGPPSKMSEGSEHKGINGRLRPRKPNTTYVHQLRNLRKSEQLKIEEGSPSSLEVQSPKIEDIFLPTSQSTAKHVFEHGKQPYLCLFCDRQFPLRQSLCKHMQRVHQRTSRRENNIRCPYCGQKEANVDKLFPHLVEYHASQYFACLTCFVRFPSATDLCHHLQTICSLHKIPNTAFLPIDIESSKTPANSLEKIRKKKKYRQTDSEAIEKEPTHNLRSNSQSTGQDSVVASTSQNDKSESINNLQLDKNVIIILDDTSQLKNNPGNDDSDKELLTSGLSTAQKPHSYLEVDQGNPDKEFQDAIKCFDDDFYSKVTTNVNVNLTNYLDGTLTTLPFANSSDVDLEECETVTVNAIDGFPTLLAVEQYAKGSEDLLQRRPILKHKWKTDASDSDRHSEYDKQMDTLKNNGGHLPQCILPLISGLDIWTQIQMRKKFEDVSSNELTNKNKKKLDQNRKFKSPRQEKSTSRIGECPHTKLTDLDSQNFPLFLGLQYTQSKFETTPALLSGEWARPRCYVCCACGNRSEDPRSLSTHDSTYHPFTQSSHYEVVGKDLLDADILKHLYVPKSQMPKRLRPPRGTHTCTKCGKAVTADELHPHILECAGDTQVVRRKNRNRLFGVRKRRSRVADEDALNHRRARKRARRNKRDRLKRLSLQPRVRTEVGDAETIKKMLENLPAKRHHRESSTLENPSNGDKVRKSDWSTMHKKRHAAKLGQSESHATAFKQENDEPHSKSSSLQLKSMDTIPTMVSDLQVRSTVSGNTDEIPNKSDLPTKEISSQSDKLKIKSTDELTPSRVGLQEKSPDTETIILKDVKIPMDIVGQETDIVVPKDIKIPSESTSLRAGSEDIQTHAETISQQAGSKNIEISLDSISSQTESKDTQIHTETISQQVGSLDIKIHSESIGQQALLKDIDIVIPCESSYNLERCPTDVIMPIESIELEVLSTSDKMQANLDPIMAEIRSETVLDVTNANKSNNIVVDSTKNNEVHKGETLESTNRDNLNEITQSPSTEEHKDIVENPSTSNSNTEQPAEVCGRSCNIINEKSINNNFETKFGDSSINISQISKHMKPAQLFKPYIDLLEKIPENQLNNKKQCVEVIKCTGSNDNTMTNSRNTDVITRPPIISAEKCLSRPHKPKRGLNECISLLMKGKFAADPSTMLTGEQTAPMDLSIGRRDATPQITPMRVFSVLGTCSQEKALDFSTRPFHEASKPPIGTKFDVTNFLSLDRKTTCTLISPEFKNSVGTNTFTQSITIKPKSNEIYCNTSLLTIPKPQTREMATITMEETGPTDSSISVTKNLTLQDITKTIVQSCTKDHSNTRIVTPSYGEIDYFQLPQAANHNVEFVSSHENIESSIKNIPNKREKIFFSLREPIQTQHWTPPVRKVGQENGTASLRAVRIKSASDKPRNVVITKEPSTIKISPETQNGINCITEKLKDVETPDNCDQPNNDSSKLISSNKQPISTKSNKELNQNDTIKPQELSKEENIETNNAVKESHDLPESMIVNKEINNDLSNIESESCSPLDTKLTNDMNTECVKGNITCNVTDEKETEIILSDIVTAEKLEIDKVQSTCISLLLEAKDDNDNKTDLEISTNSLTKMANANVNHVLTSLEMKVTEMPSIPFADLLLSSSGPVEKEIDSNLVLLNDNNTLTSSKLNDITANSENIDQEETSNTEISLKIEPSVVHSSEDTIRSQKESILVAINIDNLLVSLDMSEKENKHHNERQSSEDSRTVIKRPEDKSLEETQNDHECEKNLLTIQNENENRSEQKVINSSAVKLSESPKNQLPEKDKSKSKIVHRRNEKTLSMLYVDRSKIKELPIVCPITCDPVTKELRVSNRKRHEPPVATSGTNRLCYDSDDNVPLSVMVGKKLSIRNKSKLMVRNMRKTTNKLEKPKLTAHNKIERRRYNKSELRRKRTQFCPTNKSIVSDENDATDELNQNNNGILIISQKSNELTTENVSIFKYIHKVQDYHLKPIVEDLCATTVEKGNDNLSEQAHTNEFKVVIPANTHFNNEIFTSTTTSTDDESTKRLQSPIVKSVALDISTSHKRKIELCNSAIIRKKPRKRRQNIFREPKRYKKKPTKRSITYQDSHFDLGEQSTTDKIITSNETTIPTNFIGLSDEDLQKNKKEAKLNMRRPTRMVKRCKHISRDKSSSESRSTSQDTVPSDSQSRDSLYNVKENLDEYSIGSEPQRPGKLFTRAKKKNTDCLKIHTKSNLKVHEAESTAVISDSLLSYSISPVFQSKIVFDRTKTRERNDLPCPPPEPTSLTSTDSSNFVSRSTRKSMINKSKSKEGTQGYITESEEESVTLRQLAEVKAGKQKTDSMLKNVTKQYTDLTLSSSVPRKRSTDSLKSAVGFEFNLKVNKAQSTPVDSGSLFSFSVSPESQSDSSNFVSRRARTSNINKTQSEEGIQGYITESEEESVTLCQLAEVKAGKHKTNSMLKNVTEESTDLTDSSFEPRKRSTDFPKSAVGSEFDLKVNKAQSTPVNSDSLFSFSVSTESQFDSSSFVSTPTRTSMMNKKESKEGIQEYITESEEESVTLCQLAEVKAGKHSTDSMLKNITEKYTNLTESLFDLGETNLDFLKMHTNSNSEVNEAESTAVISDSLLSYSISPVFQSKIIFDQTKTRERNDLPCLPPEPTSQTSTDSSSFVSRHTRISMLKKTKSKKGIQGYITESEEESVTLRQLAEVKAGKHRTDSMLKNTTEKYTNLTDSLFDLVETGIDSLKMHTNSNLKVNKTESTAINSDSLFSYSLSPGSQIKTIDQSETRERNNLPSLLPKPTSQTSTDSSSFVSRHTRTSMINKSKSKKGIQGYKTEGKEKSVTLCQLAVVKAGKQRTYSMPKNLTQKSTEHSDRLFEPTKMNTDSLKIHNKSNSKTDRVEDSNGSGPLRPGKLFTRAKKRDTDCLKIHTESNLKVDKAEPTATMTDSLLTYSVSRESPSKIIDQTETREKNTLPCLLPEPTSETSTDSSNFVSRRTRTSMVNKTKSKEEIQGYITESEEEGVTLSQLAKVKAGKRRTDSILKNIKVKSTDHSDSSSEPDFTKYLSTKTKAKQISSMPLSECGLSSNTQTGLGKLSITHEVPPFPNVYQPNSESAKDFDLGESEDFEKHSLSNNSVRKSDNNENPTDLAEKKSTEKVDITQIDKYFENFGFFGQRQPRKSNLLASKKIHETFKANAEDESTQSNSTDAKSIKHKRKRGALQNKKAIRSKSTRGNTRVGNQISSVPRDKMLILSSQSDSESSYFMPLMEAKRVKRASLFDEPKLITTEKKRGHAKKENMHNLEILPKTSKAEASCMCTPQEFGQIISNPAPKNVAIQPIDLLVPQGTESKKIIKVGGKELTCDEAFFYEVCSLLRNAEGKHAVRLVCGKIITLDNSDPKNIVISFDPPSNDLQGADRNNANSCDYLASEGNQDMSAEDLEQSVIKTLMQNRELQNSTHSKLNLAQVDKKNESKVDIPALPHVFEDKFDIIKRKSSARSASAVATGRSTVSSSGNRIGGNSASRSVSRLASGSRTSTTFSRRNSTNSNQRAVARTTKVATTPTTVITTHPTEAVINQDYCNQSATKKISESPKAIEQDQVKTIIADILSQPTLINDIEKVPTKAERKGSQGLKKGQTKCPFISRPHKHSLCKQRLRLFFAHRKKLAADSAPAKGTQSALPSRSNANPYDVYDFSDGEDVEEFDCITMEQINKIFDALNKTGADKNYYIEETDSEEDFIYTSGHVFNKKRYGAMSTGSLCSSQQNTYPEKSAVVGKIFKNVARDSRNDKIVVGNGNDKRRKRRVGKNKSEKTQSYHQNVENSKDDKENEKHQSGKEKSTLDELFDSLLVTPTVIPLDLVDKSQNIEHNAYQSSDYSDSNVATVEPETGIARQRTRRKCAVGKQNVLAESWSSESDEETSYSNYHSARRKKTNRQPVAVVATPIPPEPPQSQHVRDLVEASTSSSTNPTLRRDRGIFRPAYSLSSSDDEEPHQLVQQHGWIVGNSHKKLVTMLAHAKGRKKEGSKKGGDKDEYEFND